MTNKSHQAILDNSSKLGLQDSVPVEFLERISTGKNYSGFVERVVKFFGVENSPNIDQMRGAWHSLQSGILLYDDMIDSGKDSPALGLFAASSMTSGISRLYQSCPDLVQYSQVIEALIDRTTMAVALETRAIEGEISMDIVDLALAQDRMGFSLIWIISCALESKRHTAISSIIACFQHLVGCYQIMDDVADFPDDIMAGRRTSVTEINDSQQPISKLISAKVLDLACQSVAIEFATFLSSAVKLGLNRPIPDILTQFKDVIILGFLLLPDTKKNNDSKKILNEMYSTYVNLNIEKIKDSEKKRDQLRTKVFTFE